MTTDAELAQTVGRGKMRVGYILLAAAWLVWIAGLIYGHVLYARFTGPAEDVVDSLNRAAFVAERTRWFGYGMLVLDLFANFALIDAWVAGRQQAWRMVGVGLALGSVFLHGLQALVGLCLAG